MTMEETMKKKIEQNDFYKYRYLGGLQASPARTRAVFAMTRINAGKNSYETCLYVSDGRKTQQLTSGREDGTFAFADENSVLILRPDKSRSGINSAFWRMPLDGGEAVHEFDLPLAVTSFRALNEKYWLMEATVDLNHPQYHALKEEERKKADARKKDEEDYQVLEEYPFWWNGKGYVDKTRHALFLVDRTTHQITAVSPHSMDVDSVDCRDGRILYSGIRFTSSKGVHADVLEYDAGTGKNRTLYGRRRLEIQRVFYQNGAPMVLGTYGRDYGPDENPKLYRLKDGEAELVLDLDLSIGSSLITDVCYGEGRDIETLPKSTYLLITEGHGSSLMKLENSALKKVWEPDGGIVDFTILKDGILAVGLFGQKLEELYLLKGGRSARITAFNEDCLKDRYVAVPQKCTVAKKPFAIEGWVLAPYGYDPKGKYPAILDIHGGPRCAYGTVFMHEMQYWASQGCFVFFCNPRGGSGRGSEFGDLRQGWGSIDYEDLMDFTDAVLKRFPAIDVRRVGVTGGSYGGYMTNWVIGHTDRFAAAASQRSISNWLTEVMISDCGVYWPRSMGFKDPKHCAAELWDQSPLKYADQARTPTLFIHSFEDHRCPIEEGIQMYTALKCRGVDSRLVGFKGENHELSRSGKPLHRTRRLQEITDWIMKYCG